MPEARLAIDIGGTFTDVVLELDGRHVTAKVLTTPRAPELGVMAGFEKVRALSGVDPAQIRLVIHGTTLATNALIERRGAKTALVVTSGHRDALEMAHENRFEQYDIGVDRPVPLVPRYLRIPVEERIDRNGDVLVPLDEDSVRALVPVLVDNEVESAAVGLLHAYANPRHEQRVRDLLREALPSLPITLASEVCPEVREYERLSTACANAYVQPLMSRYLVSLADALREARVACPFLLMTSGGGLTTLETATAFPIRLVESGPAGGAILASHVARQCGLDRVISFDMGGTTAKLCIVDGGQPLSSRHFEVARSYRFRRGSGLPVRVPVIEMVEIGAGGGSIASVDTMGQIRVGPLSAGSEPGPASYGRGGTLPTVTDADVALGRLDPGRFAGGSISIDPSLAKSAVATHVGARLGLEEGLAAYGISEMVDENMANAARTHAIEWGKGVDGRAMVAFGGSAPIHAARLIEKLDLDRVLVPNHAGVGSAVGFLLAPISYEVVRSRYMRLSAYEPRLVESVLSEMLTEAQAVVAQGAPDAATVSTAQAFMRYVGQGHEIGVQIPDDIRDDGQAGGALLRQSFDDAYAELYGRTIPGLDVEVLSWTLVVSTTTSAVAPLEAPPASPSMPTPTGTSELVEDGSGGSVEADVFSRSDLAPGVSLEGPALIVEDQTTTVVPTGFEARVAAGGYLVLTRITEEGTSERPVDSSDGLGPQDGRESTGLDLLHDQIMWSRLLSVVEEQAQTLVRTAFSTPVREAGDLSAGVFDLSGRMLAQAITGTPGHVNAMAESVGHFLERFPVASLRDGDVLITNDPWKGTGHLNDFTVVTPTFRNGEAVALFAATSHIADVGGRGFGPDANQVFEEGIRIPISYLMRGGQVDATLIELIRANVRDPDVAEGDLYSLVACNRTGCERLVAMMDEFGLADLERLADFVIERSRLAMLERIREIRPGRYKHQMRIDGYDQEIDLVCTLEVSADGIEVDFDGTSPISNRGINVPVTYTRAYASFGVRCVVGSEIPNNAGSLGTIHVTAPRGSILNAPDPAAVSARHAVGQMLPDVVLGCLGQALETPVPAEGASCLWNPVLMGGAGLTGEHSYGDADPFVVNPFHTGGTGARPGKDGLSATAFPSGVRSTPIEITETVAPLVFWRKEYITDSGGPGRHRGGLGQVMEIAHADGSPFAISKMFDRVSNPARGRDGGGPGATGRVYLQDGKELRGMGRDVVPPGGRLVLETPGGGGLGDPAERDASEVRDDVLNGYVSENAAREVYGDS
jgi:N-methylhydantoinase A/oxoprolinase/acetone carboxylase beta subunit/N-methylhydantoinase B/oxoprolinase/acetone carboxylase alpha subunit